MLTTLRMRLFESVHAFTVSHVARLRASAPVPQASAAATTLVLVDVCAARFLEQRRAPRDSDSKRDRGSRHERGKEKEKEAGRPPKERRSQMRAGSCQ